MIRSSYPTRKQENPDLETACEAECNGFIGFILNETNTGLTGGDGRLRSETGSILIPTKTNPGDTGKNPKLRQSPENYSGKKTLNSLEQQEQSHEKREEHRDLNT